MTLLLFLLCTLGPLALLVLDGMTVYLLHESFKLPSLFASWQKNLPPCPTVQIRFATEEDADVLAAITEVCFPPTLLAEADEDNTDEELTLVAVVDRRVVGYVRLCAEQEAICIDELAVEPGYRLRAVLPLLRAVHHLLISNHVSEVISRCREKTSYRLLTKHGQAIGFVVLEASMEAEIAGECLYFVRLGVQAPQMAFPHTKLTL